MKFSKKDVITCSVSFFKNKKGLGGVVATSLLIVVAVASIISFQTWFNTYSSSLYLDSDDRGTGISTRVERVVGDTIYFNNQYSNLTINDVQVEGVSCNVTSSSYSSGIESFDGTDCLNGTDSGIKEVVIITNKGIFSSKFVYSGSLSSGSGSQSGSAPQSTDTFISTWNTSIIGTSTSNQIQLPLISGGTYNFNVTGSALVGSPVTINSYTDNVLNFSTVGLQTIEIRGQIEGWSFNNGGDAAKITEISQWGPLKLGSSGSYFYGASNLQITATDLLNTSGTTTFINAFRDTSSITTIPNIEYWDTSSVSSLYAMFHSSGFNDDVSGWDTSGVTTMGYAFASTPNFNQNLSSWDTSSVTGMEQMFVSATSFNGDITDWNVSSVDNMDSMFSSAGDFNQDLSNWTTSNVTDMSSMFMNAESFDGNITQWDTSSVTDMFRMFYSNSGFNQDIGGWNTSSVIDMRSTFQSASAFNQNLSSWDADQVGAQCSNFDASASSWTLPKPANIDPSCLS